MLENTDEQAANDVDQHDQDTGYRVAANELRCAVHRTKELRFLGDRRAAFACLVLADQAGVEVCVNRHLLARHGVEGEAGGHLGNAPGTLGDHHEIDHHQNCEHHQANSIVAADQEMPECFDHSSGGTGAGMAFEQNHPCRSDVERQP